MSNNYLLERAVEENSRVTAAVIGVGSAGLVTLKNLRELGFDAFGFERRKSVGGLWAYDEDQKITSALPTTVANGSKQQYCFTDFPYPEDAKSFPPQYEIEAYMKSYAEHFNLYPHIRFGTTVVRVFRDESDTKWVIEYSVGEETKLERVEVEKVVFTHGEHTIPHIPEIAGLELFKGEVVHTQAFKTPEPYKGKRVLIFGCNNTAADTAMSLVGIASEIYFSHRRGVRMAMPRFTGGKPIDHGISHRIRITFDAIDSVIPGTSEFLIDSIGKIIEKQTYKVDPKWGFGNAPSICQCVPVCSDNLENEMHKGSVIPVVGVERVVGEDEILLRDGTKIHVDKIVFATGYRPNLSITPTSELRLYQSIFPLTYSTSLAYVGFGATLVHSMVQFDLSSMYAAQVFCGLTKLPPLAEMEKTIAKQEKWTAKHLARGSVAQRIFPVGPWLRHVSKEVGTGVWEKLGYGWEGWKFWWNDRKFCKLAMDGINSPHLYRLFEGEGKRPVWKGAREAICKSNSVGYIPPPKS